MALVYVGMAGDMLHAGHVNVINHAKALGDVMIGLLTDEALVQYKRLPFMPFEARNAVVQSLKDIFRVVPQETLSYRVNLEKYRPDIVVHGDDWRTGPQRQVRLEAIEVLAQWGGKLVEIPYSEGVSSTMFHAALHEQGVLARIRQGKFGRLLETKPLLRLIEVHNSLSAVVAETTRVDGQEFDGFWSSSLTDSVTRGRPDIEVVDPNARLSSISDIFDVTTKPLVYDGDTGGSVERIYYLAKSLERAGVSALCLEDKIGPKRNSLYGLEAHQTQAKIEQFCEKIGAAKAASANGHFLVIGRIESLVLGKPIADALERAHAYCDAGADGILIHSVAKTGDEVCRFAEAFRTKRPRIPLFVVPTTYDGTREDQLGSHGVNVVIYANHLLRAAYPAMQRAARDILVHRKAGPLNEYCASSRDLLSLFPEPDVCTQRAS